MDYVACSNCKQENFITTQFCTHCGFWLKDAVDQTFLKTISVELQFKIGKHFSTQNLPPKLSSTEIAFHLIEANELIKFDYTKPIVLGRGSKSRTQANHFINLSNYNAYALGMSRDHVQIKLVERHYYISDLATSNGTLVNGKSVLPTKAYLLANSDIIILSRLALVFYQG